MHFKVVYSTAEFNRPDYAINNDNTNYELRNRKILVSKKQLAEIQINDQENKTNIALMFLAILNELGVNNGFKTSIEIEICL